MSLSPTRVPRVAVRERGLRKSWQESRGWRVRRAGIQEPPCVCVGEFLWV